MVLNVMESAEKFVELKILILRYTELIRPLEQQGILVRRSRATEIEIDQFTNIERDNMIIGRAALILTHQKKLWNGLKVYTIIALLSWWSFATTYFTC